MSFAPVNYYAGFDLVPVFEWELVESTQDADAQPAPASTDCADPDLQQPLAQDPDSPDSNEMRLVFKGYEWRFSPGIATFPRPDWMDGITAGVTDEADESRQQEEERKRASAVAHARHSAVPQPGPDLGPDNLSSGCSTGSDDD
jgi:hypothetical protein